MAASATWPRKGISARRSSCCTSAQSLQDWSNHMAGELILVVEDNDKNRKLVRNILEFRGYRIIEVTTAEEGLEIACVQHPALILMDIHLPGMDGSTAFTHLNADPRTSKIPVIALPASAMPKEPEVIKL